MLESLTLGEALAGIERGDFSADEVTAALDARIDSLDPHLNAYVHRAPAGAGAAAGIAPAGGPLCGLPFTLKDNMNLRGTPTGCASRILASYESPYDCTAAARLLAAGGRYLGKTNMDEFGMGSSNEYSAHGPVRNPWDLARAPGGSSGGAAAAVAADLALFALGSDTGGSIRQPAALCGVVGAKPTYGRVSRYGLVAFASSLDQIGPLAKDVADAARVLELIMGPDPRDATSLDAPVPRLLAAARKSARGLRVGLPEGLAVLGLDDAVAAAWEAAAAALAAQGAERVAVSLPRLRHATAAYYLLATAEASSNLARYDGVRYGLRAAGAADLDALYRRSRAEGFGPEVRRRIMLGTFALSRGYYEEYYLRAQKLRTLLARDFDQAWERCDCLLLPTTPGPAFRLGERLDDPLAMYLGDVFTLPVNLAGLPAVSVPTAVHAGLPLGMQVVGRPLDEVTVFRAAAALERAFPFRETRRRAVAAALDAGDAP
ncbi:MAG: Asp-tRNA(Asn)/Glu-tRNA(Gln) amidotransferase subunit GatA [Candidatus Krumholzibacteriota bacterium]|nr:Asp-tRNA(Asn)/Glu-tRNA(Gln) amidotransferase subunit GatA [Candidatus Krumholzibacteriota bacterium]